LRYRVQRFDLLFRCSVALVCISDIAKPWSIQRDDLPPRHLPTYVLGLIDDLPRRLRPRCPSDLFPNITLEVWITKNLVPLIAVPHSYLLWFEIQNPVILSSIPPRLHWCDYRQKFMVVPSVSRYPYMQSMQPPPVPSVPGSVPANSRSYMLILSSRFHNSDNTNLWIELDISIV
jgi:hypothetical protein